MGKCASKPKSSSDEQHFYHNYGILDAIGAGGFGTIYTAIHAPTTSTVVVKFIKKKNVYRTDVLEDMIVPREVKIMAQLSHPSIIQLLDVYRFRKSYALVMDYLPNWIDLFDFTAKMKYLDEDKSKIIFKQLLTVLDHLHCDIGVAHLDVKPENILVDPESLQIKLLDFGAANYIIGEKYSDFDGTKHYACPEVLFKMKYDPVDADIWAAGVTLYRLVVGYLPFRHPDSYYSKLNYPKHLSVFCQHILSMMLCRQSDLRPKSVKALQRAPWILF